MPETETISRTADEIYDLFGKDLLPPSLRIHQKMTAAVGVLIWRNLKPEIKMQIATELFLEQNFPGIDPARYSKTEFQEKLFKGAEQQIARILLVHDLGNWVKMDPYIHPELFDYCGGIEQWLKLKEAAAARYCPTEQLEKTGLSKLVLATRNMVHEIGFPESMDNHFANIGFKNAPELLRNGNIVDIMLDYADLVTGLGTEEDIQRALQDPSQGMYLARIFPVDIRAQGSQRRYLRNQIQLGISPKSDTISFDNLLSANLQLRSHLFEQTANFTPEMVTQGLVMNLMPEINTARLF